MTRLLKPKSSEKKAFFFLHDFRCIPKGMGFFIRYEKFDFSHKKKTVFWERS